MRRDAELGLMLSISEPGEGVTFSYFFVYLNIKQIILTFFFLRGTKERNVVIRYLGIEDS